MGTHIMPSCFFFLITFTYGGMHTLECIMEFNGKLLSYSLSIVWILEFELRTSDFSSNALISYSLAQLPLFLKWHIQWLT